MPQRTPRLRSKTLSYIPLSIASEAITFTLLINKLTGLYGILALFTGYSLNALQLSMYIYSILILGLGLYLSQSIRSRDSIQVLGLAWLYMVDSLLNTLYTILFGVGWFKMLAGRIDSGEMASGGPTSVIDTEAFTGKTDTGSGLGSRSALGLDTKLGKGLVSGLGSGIAPEPGSGSGSGSDKTVATVPQTGASANHDPVPPTTTVSSDALSKAFMANGSLASIVVICLLLFLRLAACWILVLYARQCLRRNGGAGTGRGRESGPSSAVPSSAVVRSILKNRGHGVLRVKVGRIMTAFPGPRFWLGEAGEQGWGWEAGEKFRVEK